MRIGILQCDSVAPDLQPDFGDYPDMFRRLLSTVDAGISYVVYDLPNGVFPESLDECDGWITTGSKWSVYDDAEWIARAEDLVRRLHHERAPTVGICFGHQLIARALGGRVEKAGRGWGVGIHTASILARPDWMDPPATTLSLVVSHQDQVISLPQGAEPLAGHDFCPCDMMQIGNHMLTFQGHPEFSREYSRAMMERRRGLIDDTTINDGLASLAAEPDDALAARWILRFLGGIQRAQPRKNLGRGLSDGSGF